MAVEPKGALKGATAGLGAAGALTCGRVSERVAWEAVSTRSRTVLAAIALAGLAFAGISGAAGAAGGSGGPFDAASPLVRGGELTALEPQTLTVRNGSVEGGGVTSAPAGISCGTKCSAVFEYGSSVTLNAIPREEEAFAGFHGDCSEAAEQCTLTMDAAKTVRVNFFGFGFYGVSLNKKRGTGLITFKVGGRGRLVLSGGSVEKQVKVIPMASTYSLPVLPKGAAARALRKTGRAKLRLRAAFTPPGGTAAVQSVRLTMRRNPAAGAAPVSVSCLRLRSRENETAWRCSGRG
jgi:hypothetical protein